MDYVLVLLVGLLSLWLVYAAIKAVPAYNDEYREPVPYGVRFVLALVWPLVQWNLGLSWPRWALHSLFKWFKRLWRCLA